MTTPAPAEILRYTAFSTDPAGGNPAGVVLDARALDDETMLAVAAEVGYSESAFVTERDDAERRFQVRYFSPLVEVDFCGHATIATAVALAELLSEGPLVFATKAGEITLDTGKDDSGAIRATLTSVPTRTRPASDAELDAALAALRWSRDDLDPALPPHVAFGGVEHLVLAAATRERLRELDYDFDGLAEVMRRHHWITLQLVWREDDALFHARDPFPIGGVVEDPATGAAAAALGGYLRELGALPDAGAFTIRQGEDMGRPSLLRVESLPGTGRIRVSGTAVRL
ncbi:PhzF family phenazine biosynthesis isomerase [Streptacidiphilus jiangxiensis]|uniref:Phenazine biosynthesis protein PhzF family n=1 Tax=Streptacidiphilus jiangxiensis TaxID=235985 RepID=A0A1H7RAV5_STRJI|nr:PhzF family phenazine biosynthesis isomerase [Streptacidiphilus jiangxiensis]SEL57269.1 phenazine biosynthesis protein PhzF family [Streptacidiphilus jiangxiensis]